MSIRDSVRGLTDAETEDLLRNRHLPTKTFTVGLPGNENSWVKRVFLRRDEKTRDAQDDATWEIQEWGGEW